MRKRMSGGAAGCAGVDGVSESASGSEHRP